MASKPCLALLPCCSSTQFLDLCSASQHSSWFFIEVLLFCASPVEHASFDLMVSTRSMPGNNKSHTDCRVCRPAAVPPQVH
jgi:hypothetical protein